MNTTTPKTEETLDQALSRIWEHDWRHRRSGATLRSQAEKAIEALHVAVRARLKAEHGGFEVLFMLGAHNTTKEDIQAVTRSWYIEGLSPATIQKRLNCLSKLGVNVTGCRVNVPKQLKWHLSEANLEKLRVWLDDRRHETGRDELRMLLNFIFWTCRTGLRIEESLALSRKDFSGLDGDLELATVMVPGLKTASAQATLPLSEEAAQCAIALFWDASDTPTAKMMPYTYEDLNTWWQPCREFLGATDDPTATLKALRRSAARYLHVDCGMPLDMVRQYLRHEKIETTMEYLRLTGGYGTEEMRRYLK